MKRRDFLTKIAIGLPAVAWIACTKKEDKMSEEEVKALREKAKNYHQSIKYVSEGDPIAKNLNYVEYPDDNPTPDRKDKDGTPGGQQYCENCQFYVVKEGKNYGECQLLQGRGMVRAKAWCKSWVIKRNV